MTGPAPRRVATAARRAARPAGLTLAFVVLAAAIRWPALHDIPRYTDETGEVATAIAIAFDGARPLVHNDAYRGPFWAYLLAGVLAWTGPDPDVPRRFALGLGALAVGATYLLGRAVAGRLAGGVAALLMATAFGPVALGSHVPWSNNSTPLWVALATLALHLGSGGTAARADAGPAIRPGRRADTWLALAGLLWGLALQTHPSVLALLPGAALWFVAAADRRARLRAPGPWLAAAVFVASLAPILVHNVRAGSAVYVEDAFNPSQPVAEARGPAALAANLVALAGQVGRSAGAGPPREPGDPRPDAVVGLTDALRPAATAAYALAILGALAWAAWRGPRRVAAPAASAVAILPWITDGFRSFHDMRYVVVVLPLGYVALGASVARAAPGSRARQILSIGVVALALYALVATAAFYRREAAADRTNAPIRAATAWLAAHAAEPGDHVLLDKAMRDLKLGGGGNVTRALEQRLVLMGLAPTVADVDEIRWFVGNDDGTLWILAADATVAQLRSEAGGAAIQDVPEAGAGPPRGGWRVVRRAAGER